MEHCPRDSMELDPSIQAQCVKDHRGTVAGLERQVERRVTVLNWRPAEKVYSYLPEWIRACFGDQKYEPVGDPFLKIFHRIATSSFWIII
jgi:hypothetical protein